VLNPQAPTIIGSPDIMIDGVYAWPGDLPFYVRRYHVRLRDDFVAHMRANGWTVPPLSRPWTEFVFDRE
jgi:hypothetical protein